MWTYAPWQGRYLPGSLSPRDRLRAYATWCNAVEGNTTFYATPALGTVRSWAEQTAPDFRFVLKLPKPVTHERRLVDAEGSLRAFLAAIEPLGSRAHALWIQLPPSFGPADLDALAGFLHCLPHEYRYCVEVRHRAFFEDPRSEQRLETALGDVDAEWVTFDTTVLFESPPVSGAEREVVRLVSEGLRNDAIARRLFVTPGTVKVHLTHIFAKTGITSRAELAAQAASQDLSSGTLGP